MALLMKAGAIVRTILFGFVMYGVAAHAPQQSPPSPERGGAVRQRGPLLADLAGPQPAERSSGALQTQPEVEFRRLSLLSGASIESSPEWIEREQMPLAPSPRLAPFAPQVTFLEFTALENPKMHSVLRIATTTNPFLGGDEVALDVQMHAAAGSGNGLADYLFYFFFSPPRDCLDGGSEAYRKAKSQARLPYHTVAPDLSILIYCKNKPTLADFYSIVFIPSVTFSFPTCAHLS